MTTDQTTARATNRKQLALGATALGAAALLAACGTQTRQASTGTTASGAAEPQVVAVQAREFAFSESIIRVQAGRPVRIVVDNAGVIEHDLKVVNLPASDVRLGGDAHGQKDEIAAHAAAGKQAWVEFTPTKKGTYDVVCTITGHKEAGMKGTLIVE